MSHEVALDLPAYFGNGGNNSLAKSLSESAHHPGTDSGKADLWDASAGC